MFWADRIAADIIAGGKFKPYRVDDMFTPSGYAHIGSLRGPLVHDIIYRALVDAGQKAVFTYVFNDFDPVDGLSPDLAHLSAELGKPLRMAKSPQSGFASFAEFFRQDFEKVLTGLGVRAEYLSSWDMYHSGKFDTAIRTALDHAKVIQDIYQRVSGSKKREKGWLPLQVVCEKCGRLGTTRVHDWDGQTVAYTCEPDMVAWAKGCGFTGRTSPFTDPKDPVHHPGKLPWKVDWPAHWSVMGITVEGAGKDHSSAGGSRDIARELCRDVFAIPEPYNLPYEFFLIGGRKMSSSKGLGLKGRDLTSLLPASVGRFLFTRTDYRQAIEFDPVGSMAIPDLFDEYDRSFQAYVSGSDPDLARAFVLSQVDKLPKKEKTFLPRFRDVANYVQQKTVDLGKKFAEMKGAPLNTAEKAILDERIRYAEIWVDRYAPDEYRYRMTKTVPIQAFKLTNNQRQYLSSVPEALKGSETPDELQLKLYEQAKNMGTAPADAFGAIYAATIGTTHGPKAAWLLWQYPKDVVAERLNQVAAGPTAQQAEKIKVEYMQDEKFFTIDPKVRQAYPSISIGIAIIRGITVTKSHPDLEKAKADFLSGLRTLTTVRINAYPEITSYRKLYREMGVDWHSRRPSPEALLRRVALGKGLYTVNTCADAYNLAVMRNRVSVGAFDYGQISFPTVLRYAGAGDSILLHGDTRPTVYTARELAYYDQNGGYNIDFNFRDAQRSLVTEKTNDILINVDGVFDITPDAVYRTLLEAIDLIIKYCGGKLEMKGVVV